MRTPVSILTSRDIGLRCVEWAQNHVPPGFDLFLNDPSAEIIISVLYDKLFTEEFIRSKKAVFNFHPGILPEYRGAGSFSWALLNRDKFFGVTLHRVDKDIDHGPILEMESRTILPQDTAYSMFQEGEAIIFNLFKHWWPKLLAGDFVEMPQDESRAAIYYRKDLEAAKDITHIVKAFHFPGKESCFFVNSKGEKVYVQYA